MALAVKNTFVHYSQQEDSEQHCRSNSAPPAYRLVKQGKKDDISPSGSTTCESLAFENTTVNSDSSHNDDVVSYCDTNLSDYEDVSLSASRDEINGGDDDAYWQPDQQQQLSSASHESAQQQLEQMSEMVMEIWAKLRAVEASTEAPCQPCQDVEASTQPVKPATQKADKPRWADTTDTQQGGLDVPRQKLSAKACAYVPNLTMPDCKTSDVQKVFAGVKQAVMLTPGVADVSVSPGPAGTLVTISVKLDSYACKPTVSTACKTALLDVAARSESTYVLGYMAPFGSGRPFEDDVRGSGFFATLASVPASMECSTCWDTYTMGCCSKPRSCKKRHPGVKDLQPVKIVVG